MLPAYLPQDYICRKHLHIPMNPKAIESTAGKCKYYCSNKKVRYAKGFIHTAEAISVGQSGTFRYRLIGLWGIRRYYQKRKGETLLSPTEQQQVIAIARNLGLYCFRIQYI